MEATENTARRKEAVSASVFTVEEVMNYFGAEFLDEDFCRVWVLQKLHPEDVACCPQCGEPVREKLLPRFWGGLRLCCNSCGKFFTALTGTFLCGCHLDYTQVILLALFLYLKLPSETIAEKLDVSTETVRLWRQKFEANDVLKKWRSE